MRPHGPPALQPTHHLPPEDPDPLVSLHTRLGTQVERPLGEDQAKDVSIFSIGQASWIRRVSEFDSPEAVDSVL